MIGAPETEAMFNKSLFFISIGSNDIFNYSPSEDGTANAFVSLLISTYSKHITVRTVFLPIKPYKFLQ